MWVYDSMYVLGHVFLLRVYFNMCIANVILCLCTFQKQEKYKDTEPTAIDLFKLTHCSKTKGFSDEAKKAAVSTSIIFLVHCIMNHINKLKLDKSLSC